MKALPKLQKEASDNEFATGAAARGEYYEIAAYEGLIASAEAMDELKGRHVCHPRTSRRNRRLEKLKEISKRLAPRGRQ